MSEVPTFDIDNFRGSVVEIAREGRLERQYRRIEEKHDSGRIRGAVEGAITNVEVHKSKSFVIYGEPQSGKTEMMIALTAGLLDSGAKMVVVLTNDSVQLLDQNLQRFQRSGLDPAPKNFQDILDNAIILRNREWIVFAKKNQSDLTKLFDKIKNFPARVIIDDEADYASPNGKVNKAADKTRINKLVGDLIGRDGIYIGVTATPARLDLNATFANDNARWVDFRPHEAYTGQDVFFPTSSEALAQLPYKLELMPDVRDDVKHLRRAFLSFLANVAYLNMSELRPGNYSMLIHTSGNKSDHDVDYATVTKFMGTLGNANSRGYASLVKELFEEAGKRYGTQATEITQFALQRINQYNIVVMNSNAAAKQSDYTRGTDPATLFTFIIGGNIVSRGVTFNNLLTMFFTRDTAHRIQQDTYIQRARMFGSRQSYLKYFELFIPKSLYYDWQRCFVFHMLSLRGIRDGLGSPIWLEDNRIKPAATASVNQAVVQWNAGEMYWEKFELTDEIKEAIGGGGSGVAQLEVVRAAMGGDMLPEHVLEFMREFSPHGDDSVALHPIATITKNYKTAAVDEITRPKGFLSGNILERSKYPKAIHHVKVIANDMGMARVYYKYEPSVDDIRVNSRKLKFMSRI